jgi:hypothetical protein
MTSADSLTLFLLVPSVLVSWPCCFLLVVPQIDPLLAATGTPCTGHHG